MKKRILASITLVISIAMLMSLIASAEWVDILADAGGDATSYPFSNDISSVAVQFNATGEFTQIGFLAASWADNIGDITMKLYKWNNGYENTLKGKPVYEFTAVGVADNNNLIYTTGAMAAGEYLAFFTTPKADDTVGMWGRMNITPAATRFYINGAEQTSNSFLSFWLDYTTVPSPAYGALSPVAVTEPATPETDAPETDAPADPTEPENPGTADVATVITAVLAVIAAASVSVLIKRRKISN